MEGGVCGEIVHLAKDMRPVVRQPRCAEQFDVEVGDAEGEGRGAEGDTIE